LRAGRNEFSIAYVKSLVHNDRAVDGIVAEHFDGLIVIGARQEARRDVAGKAVVERCDSNDLE